MKTIRLSSNWTLILKIFIPIIWITFFSSFLLGSFLANAIEVPQLTTNTFRIGVSLFVLGGIIFFYFTFFKLKRADANGEFIFISSYFKTYRYTLDSIKKYVIYDHLVFKAVHIVLKEKGSLGKRFIFIPKMLHFDLFVKETEQDEIVVKAGEE